MKPTKENCEKLIRVFSKEIKLEKVQCGICGEVSEFEYKKQIYIGDVLEEFSKKEIFNDAIYIVKIYNKWRKCGLNKSLQEIIEESGYKKIRTEYEYTDEIYGEKKVRIEQGYILKNPKARDLAQFLINIFYES